MTPEERATQLVNAYRDTSLPGWTGAIPTGTLVSHIAYVIKAAIEIEREAILKIAGEVETEAAQLILNPDLDEGEKEYYRGRGLASATIIKRIRARSSKS